MNRYIIITCKMWITENSSGVSYSSDMKYYNLPLIASNKGIKDLGHDDFLIGVLNEKDELVDIIGSNLESLDEWIPEDYLAISKSLGLNWKWYTNYEELKSRLDIVEQRLEQYKLSINRKIGKI